MQEYTIQNWMNENTTKQELQKLALREDINVSWNEIREKQWQAFNMALEMQLEAYKRKAEGKSNAWLKKEIDKVQSWINNHVEMEQFYIENKAGDTKNIGDAIITGKMYKSIKNTYENYQSGKRAAAIIEAKQGGEYSISRLFQMYVNKNYLNLLDELLHGTPTERKKMAVNMTVDSVDKKVQCRDSLTKFIELKAKNPDRSVLNIHGEIDEGNLDYGSFNGWVNKYRENLDTLKCAQEK